MNNKKFWGFFFRNSGSRFSSGLQIFRIFALLGGYFPELRAQCFSSYSRCIDPAAEPVPDQTYDESNAEGEPLGPETDTGIQSDPSTLYGAPGLGDDYSDDLNEYGNNDQFDEYSEDLANDLPPPPPPQSFEQAESSYNR